MQTGQKPASITLPSWPVVHLTFHLQGYHDGAVFISSHKLEIEIISYSASQGRESQGWMTLQMKYEKQKQNNHFVVLTEYKFNIAESVFLIHKLK